MILLDGSHYFILCIHDFYTSVDLLLPANAPLIKLPNHRIQLIVQMDWTSTELVTSSVEES